VKDKFSIGQYGNIALASDLDGNIIGFHSMT
jgi:predicted enzyme related to lactoylglutathione lyase